MTLLFGCLCALLLLWCELHWGSYVSSSNSTSQKHPIFGAPAPLPSARPPRVPPHLPFPLCSGFSSWIDKVFIPTANRQGADGWDMRHVAAVIKQEASQRGDETSVIIASFLRERVKKVGYPYFRLHPKGRGIIVQRDGGIPPFTFIEEYFGELHSGRWGLGQGANWYGFGCKRWKGWRM